MATRGRKPKSTKLHKRHGTLHPTKHRSRKNEPVAAGNLNTAPAWFTDDQKALWVYAVKNAPPDILGAIDASALTVWVEACDRHRRATQALHAFDDKEKRKKKADSAPPLLVETTTKGYFIQSPYIGIINRAGQIMLKAAGELGFTPAARPRLGVDPTDAPNVGDDVEGDPLDTFIAQHPGRSIN